MFPHDKLDWTLDRLARRVASDPEDVPARRDLARAHLAKAWFHDGAESHWNEALTHARRVVHEAPGDAVAQALAGAALVGLDRPDVARRYLEPAVAADDAPALAHLAASELHKRLGHTVPAIRAAEHACRRAPDSWEANAQLGRLLRREAEAQGLPRRVLERSQFHLVRALRHHPSVTWEPRLLHDLGVTLVHLGRHADALKVFSRLVEVEEARPIARYYLGLVSYHLGQYRNAVLSLRQHLSEAPETSHVHARLAMCHLQLGEVAKAREACHRALALAPGDLQARWTLGCALLEERRVDDAVKTFRDILAEAPQHAPAFHELVRIRREAGDARWLVAALRAEVGHFDRLPLRDPDHPAVRPRQATRDRIVTLLRALADGGPAAIDAVLAAMDLTTDEGLRFLLWESALDQLAALHADEAARWLADPAHHFGRERASKLIALAERLPEALVTKGMDLSEDDLRRAAMARHGATHDVTAHRRHVEEEREAARAWQAALLLALAGRGTRSARNLLVRWAAEADPDLADVARAGLALLGDREAANRLRLRARTRGGEPLVDALQQAVVPEEVRTTPRPVSGDEEVCCSTCGRRSSEVDHMMVGADAAVCNLCMGDIARQRGDLASMDPQLRCALSGTPQSETRAIYVFRGVAVAAEVVDQSLGLLEREEVDRWLAAW